MQKKLFFKVKLRVYTLLNLCFDNEAIWSLTFTYDVVCQSVYQSLTILSEKQQLFRRLFVVFPQVKGFQGQGLLNFGGVLSFLRGSSSGSALSAQRWALSIPRLVH